MRPPHWLPRKYWSIRTAATRKSAEIYVDDEFARTSDFRSRKTWAPRSDTPIVQVTGERRQQCWSFGVASSHRLKLATEYVDDLEGRWKFFSMLPHSADFNAGELASNDVKRKAVG